MAGKVRAGNSGVTVGIVGKTSVTTGSGGTFTFDDVPLPYDLYTVSNAITNVKTVHYYKGLTRPDPVVSSERAFVSINMSAAAINGVLSGGNGASNRWVGWGDIGGSTTNVTTASYGTFNAAWPSATNKTGFVHAMMWTTKASGGPDQIVYGSTTATLTAGNSYTVANGGNIDIALSAPTIATITGTLTPPTTFPDPDVTLTQHFGSNNLFLYTNTANGELDANIPVIASGKTNVYAVSTSGGASSFMAHPAIDVSTDASFTLPAPPTLATPTLSATGVNLSTDFTWTSPPTTVHVLTISTNETQKVSYVVYTDTTSVRIPDVAEAPLPSLQTYSWSVSGFGPHTSVNEVATQAGTRIPSPTSTAGTRHTYAVAPSRSFTSQ